MRIIGGIFRSRQLKGRPPEGIRPTSDKLRETLFNILGPVIDGATFLDGFAGMGAIGIEAVSRGAHAVYFVDRSRKACAIIRENLKSLQVTEGVRVIEAPLERALDLLERDGLHFDVVFLDPPYDRDSLYTESLAAFSTRPLLSDNAVLIMEHTKHLELPEITGNLRKYRVLTQGDSTLSFYRAERD
jgi:16S rRNA (guanine(966)-N(2))-methyltransferase RsmD